jgi:hypothetical protein
VKVALAPAVTVWLEGLVVKLGAVVAAAATLITYVKVGEPFWVPLDPSQALSVTE